MDIQAILNYYCKYGLYQSNHDYSDKIKYIEWFYQFDIINRDIIIDYCTYRSLSGVKNSTINRELTVLKSAINYYLEHNNDADFNNKLNGFKLFEDDYIPRFLTKDECQRLLIASLHFNNNALHDFILLCLNTGCRSSELLKLTWNNVYLSDNYFIIRNSLSKNKKTIYKPINDVSKEAFKRLKQHNHYVFYSDRTGNNIRSFRRGFKLAVDRSGIGYVRIHDLRHTFASFLVKSGVPLYHVSTLLGHSDIRITQKYAHLAPDNLQSVLQQIPLLI